MIQRCHEDLKKDKKTPIEQWGSRCQQQKENPNYNNDIACRCDGRVNLSTCEPVGGALVTTPTASGTASPAGDSNEWFHSVVQIWFDCEGKIFTGTGTIITTSGKVVTAGHVGKGCGKDVKIAIGTYKAPFVPYQREYTASPVDRSDVTRESEVDVALLQIKEANPAGWKAAKLATKPPFPGDALAIVGFPDLPFLRLKNNTRGTLSVYKTNLLSAALLDGKLDPIRLHYGGGSLPGMSGGPIFNDKWELIGVHSSRFTANIENLLQNKLDCTPEEYDKNRCYGNSLKFENKKYGLKEDMLITTSYWGVKSVLDNYSWGTSVWFLPDSWKKN